MNLRRSSVFAALLVAGCDEGAVVTVESVGHAERGRHVLEQFECGACHRIPGVRGPQGRVGPSLAHFGQRAYVAGHFKNSPEVVVRWILDPPSMKPATAMPNLGLTESQARDVAAYLHSLE
jgi:cytochrome c